MIAAAFLAGLLTGAALTAAAAWAIVRVATHDLDDWWP